MDLENNFQKPFEIGNTEILEAGKYAITYSSESCKTEEAHGISCLVEYNTLECDHRKKPILSACNIDQQIKKPCIAVPYHTEDDCITATEWLFLKSRDEWYNTFCDHLEKHLIEEEELDPLPRKRKHSSERDQILKEYKKHIKS